MPQLIERVLCGAQVSLQEFAADLNHNPTHTNRGPRPEVDNSVESKVGSRQDPALPQGLSNRSGHFAKFSKYVLIDLNQRVNRTAGYTARIIAAEEGPLPDRTRYIAARVGQDGHDRAYRSTSKKPTGTFRKS